MRWGFNLLKWSFILLTAHVSFSQSFKSNPDYKALFGPDYENAVIAIEEHSWWSDTLSKNGIDPCFALSVVFPELIRYSSIADYIEVKALEVLYVQYGADYADFSIGFFQMKPTFAEQIEADIIKYQLDKNHPELSALTKTASDSTDNRRDRIIRLKDEYFQLLYLEAFIRIIETMYPELAKETTGKRLVFYATAYNTGFHKGETVIRREGGKAYFHTGMDELVEKYIYSDISLDFYLRKFE